MVQWSTCPVEGLGYLHEHGSFDPRFWKRRYATIEHFTFSQWKVCLFLGCKGQTKTYKILLQYNIYSTYKIKCIPNAVWDKAAESLVTSSNSYTPVTGDVRLFDYQISGVSKNLARWNLHHTRSGNEHWESDFFIFYETKHSIKNWRNPTSYLHLNKAAS
jgi:hypothetical protein